MKSAKFHTKRIFGNAHLTFEEFGTIFAQVETMLNSRPIIPLSTEPTDLISLNSYHFLIDIARTTIPHVGLTNIPSDRLLQYQGLHQLK